MNTLERPCRILVLDDRPEDYELAKRELRKGKRPCVFERVDTREAFLSSMEHFEPDLILCDYAIPGFDGFEALALAKERIPEVPVIMYTGTLSEETAIQCLKAGADDYILKDKPARLQPAVESAIRARKDREEKARAQAKLLKSEERFRRLVETANDAIVSFKADGTVTYVNPAGETVFGIPSADLVGRPIQRLFPGAASDLLDVFTEEAGKGGGGGEPVEPLLLEASRGDGTMFPVEMSVSGWAGGGAGEFHAILRDVSEREQTREALESLSRRSELLLNSAGEGILGLEADGTVSFVNPAAARLLGLEATELLGKNPHPIIHQGGDEEESHPESACPILKALRGGTSYRGELEFFRKDGSRFPAASSCTPVLAEGRVEGAVLSFEDITSRRQQERALVESEARYRGLIENAIYGIYHSSADGRFLSVNPALVEMLGYDSREDLLSVDLTVDLYQDPAERQELMERFRKASRILGVETNWLKKDGSPIAVRLSGRPLRGGGGEVEGFEMMVEDLSERKALEDQLRHSQKMEAVGQLTGGIAHDFNNVLSVILLNAELATAAMEAGAKVEIEDLRAIHDAAQRASAITRKLLGFSRRAELLMETTKLDRVVGELAPMLRTLLPESIQLELETVGNPGPVLIDRGSVEQMLLNLVSNSRDAMPEGGRVRVEVEEVGVKAGGPGTVSEMDPGSYVRCQVEDTGVGMDPEVLDRVFDPFFTTKEPGSGTGLGMAMVYGLARQQEGHVSIDSKKGEGTVTRLYFPVRREGVEVGPSPDEAQEAPVLPATILLVEDDDTLRGVTERALERRGYRILTAADGDEALTVFESRREEIDLVLSDLVLPGRGGMEILEEIWSRWGPVRCLLTSGYSRTGQTAAENRVDSSIPFVRKPVVLRDLVGAIQSALKEPPPPLG